MTTGYDEDKAIFTIAMAEISLAIQRIEVALLLNNSHNMFLSAILVKEDIIKNEENYARLEKLGDDFDKCSKQIEESIEIINKTIEEMTEKYILQYRDTTKN